MGVVIICNDKNRVILKANGTCLKHLYYPNGWDELLVLHQGTQALKTVIEHCFLFAMTLVPLGSTTVQTTGFTKLKKHNISLVCRITTKGNLKKNHINIVQRNIKF